MASRQVAAFSVGWAAGWSAGQAAEWIAGWAAGWSVRWAAGREAGWVACTAAGSGAEGRAAECTMVLPTEEVLGDAFDAVEQTFITSC